VAVLSINRLRALWSVSQMDRRVSRVARYPSFRRSKSRSVGGVLRRVLYAPDRLAVTLPSLLVGERLG
jgi:hypothetical protein